MKALLVTACGCSRLIDIDKPGPIIVLPLNFFMKKINWNENEEFSPEGPKFPKRSFKYIGNERGHSLLGDYAMYSEVE